MKDLTKKMCFRPWDFMEIQDDTNMYPCCPNWVNQYNFGKVRISEGFENRWNGEKAQRFRESILDGSYKYCNRTQCPMIQNGSLPDKNDIRDGKHGEYYKKIIEDNVLISENADFINLCYDVSCNLKCPSCPHSIIGTEVPKGSMTIETFKSVFDTNKIAFSSACKHIHKSKCLAVILSNSLY